MYASPMDLQRHVKRGCPESDSNENAPALKRQRVED